MTLFPTFVYAYIDTVGNSFYTTSLGLWNNETLPHRITVTSVVQSEGCALRILNSYFPLLPPTAISFSFLHVLRVYLQAELLNDDTRSLVHLIWYDANGEETAT